MVGRVALPGLGINAAVLCERYGLVPDQPSGCFGLKSDEVHA